MTLLDQSPKQFTGSFEPVSFEALDGFTAEIIPKTDERVIDALELERQTMVFLGDQGVKKDQVETFDNSGFILIHDNKERGLLAGAIRYMLPKKGMNKTFRDVAQDIDQSIEYVEGLFVDQSSKKGGIAVGACTDVEAVIDASALSPNLDTMRKVGRYSDALLAACRIVGNVLFESGHMTHVTGNLHGIFIGHASKIGYPFADLLGPDGKIITEFDGNRAGFKPVFADLSIYSQLMHEAAPKSHLAKVRAAYNQLTSEDRLAIADAMLRSPLKVGL
jgi:hypothetical protein